MTPIDAFLNIVDYLEQNRDSLPDEFGEFLLPAMRATMTGKVKSMDHGLGIAVGPGEARKRLCYVYPDRQRNRLIRDAAAKLSAHYDEKNTIARLIDCAMNRGIPSLYVPDQDKNETRLSLCRLRYFCMNHTGKDITVTWQRVLQIMAGDGW